MRFFILLLFLSLVARSHAKESKLTTSPDGRYEVIVSAQADQQDIPFAQIRDKKTRKKFSTDALGYDGRAEIEAMWRPDSHIVALNFSAGKHTHDTVLYSVENGRVTKIQLPDFVLNILGRQGAISAKFKNSVVSFTKFLPSGECLLFAHVEPDPNEQTDSKAATNDTFHPTEVTDFDVILRLNNPSQTDLVEVKPSI